LIEVEGITMRFSEVAVLDSIRLTLKPGQVLGLVGHSGSGKTTLLRVMAGLQAPDAGTVKIDDIVVNDPRVVIPPHLRELSMVFQSPGLWPHMTVAENIRFTLEDRSRVEQDRRIDALLSAAGLTEYGSRFPGQLSGGEARRVSILRALAPEKRYMLMDEPLVNLDPETKAEIHRLIRSEARGRGVLYVTHDASELEGFADVVIRMRRGRIES
jgi:ABC-type Fe3+/spermidine/putrescine transport system ATPase subunit